MQFKAFSNQESICYLGKVDGWNMENEQTKSLIEILIRILELVVLYQSRKKKRSHNTTSLRVIQY